MFRQKIHLKYHLFTHADAMVYRYPKSNKRFEGKFVLKKHPKIHSGRTNHSLESVGNHLPWKET